MNLFINDEKILTETFNAWASYQSAIDWEDPDRKTQVRCAITAYSHYVQNLLNDRIISNTGYYILNGFCSPADLHREEAQMNVVYILKEHPEVQHKLENVVYLTFDSTFVWIYQIGDLGGTKSIRVKLKRISYLKFGVMTIIGERS